MMMMTRWRMVATCLDLLQLAPFSVVDESLLGVMMTVLRWMGSYLAQTVEMPWVVGHVFNEDAGDGVAELASGECVDGDVCLSWARRTPG